MKRAFRNIAALTWAALALGYSPLWAQKPKSQKEAAGHPGSPSGQDAG